MFIADIGQNQVEEINIGLPGANYGWRLREGTFATAFAFSAAQSYLPPGPVYPRPADEEAAFVYPIAQYDHDEGNAVSGGFVYRGRAIEPLTGKYVFTELVRGRLFYIDADALPAHGTATIRELRLVIGETEQALLDVAGVTNTYAPGRRADLRISQDAAGELYLLTKADGWIRKLVPAPE